MAQLWGLIIILLMRKCQRPGPQNADQIEEAMQAFEIPFEKEDYMFDV